MKKLITVGLLVTSVAMLMAACAPPKTPTPTEVPPATAPPEKSEEMEAELTVIHWGSEEERDLVAGWIAQFNEEYPNIKVEQIHVPQNYWDKVAAMLPPAPHPT